MKRHTQRNHNDKKCIEIRVSIDSIDIFISTANVPFSLRNSTAFFQFFVCNMFHKLQYLNSKNVQILRISFLNNRKIQQGFQNFIMYKFQESLYISEAQWQPVAKFTTGRMKATITGTRCTRLVVHFLAIAAIFVKTSVPKVHRTG